MTKCDIFKKILLKTQSKFQAPRPPKRGHPPPLAGGTGGLVSYCNNLIFLKLSHFQLNN